MINYHSTKTADLVALAAARQVEVVTVDGKTDRKALIAALARDQAEQDALEEDAAGTSEPGHDGSAMAAHERKKAEADLEEQAGGENERSAGQSQGDKDARHESDPPADLPAVGSSVHVIVPSGSVQPAKVLSHQGGDLLELECTESTVRGLKTYHRSGCGRFVKGSGVAGWK